MQILLLEPFFTGSHKQWATDFQRLSRHEVHIVSLPGSHWKWRMHGGAISLAAKASETYHAARVPDLILASDMLDLNLFLSLTRAWSHRVSTAIYFHENQLNYPWSPDDRDVALQRDHHYAFINYASALTADHVLFNSSYHREAFTAELPKFLRAFPDHQHVAGADAVRQKSAVLPLAIDLQKLDHHKPARIEKPNRAVVLWNHRWEYDKNPDTFFRALFTLADHGIDFRLVVLGESYGKVPPVFAEAKDKLADKILHFGYADSFDDYARWLWTADVLPVTSVQDFFGASVVEAMYTNTVPFLPKRLAYPEHIPAQYHNTFFYDENDFIAKLQRRIMDVKYLRVMDTRQYALKYDWSALISVYDDIMQRMGSREEKR